MSFVNRPRIAHAGLPRNELGLTLRDYEGAMSTLCAGCGHDSVSAALVTAVFELGIAPEKVVKLSGIGCSSKTPAYFLAKAHGINALHGRMPAVVTGANAANRSLYYIGVSGDGDSLSIGLGQFAHAMRRNLDMLYIIENNGVYGLTKGQFSASADVGTRAKKGEINEQQAIDPVLMGLSLGGTFLARSFSGNKSELVPLLKAGLTHKGFALIDVLSPCVTFNDHEDSTKSYAHARHHYHSAVYADFVPPAREITVALEQGEGATTTVQLHDGSRIVLRRTAPSYDPTERAAAFAQIEEHRRSGEYLTGLLYLDPRQSDLHDTAHTVSEPLNAIPYRELSPGRAALAALQSKLR